MNSQRPFCRLLSLLLIAAMLAPSLPVARADDDTPLAAEQAAASQANVPLPRSKPKKKWANPVTACPSDDSRKTVGLCEAPVASSCTGSFSKERKEGGIGRDILNWPAFSEKSDSDYAKKVQEFQTKRKEQYLGVLSANHNSLHGKPADLKASIRARAIFFQAEFATDVLKDGSHKGFPVGVIVTCTYKRELGNYLKNYYDAKSRLTAANSETTADACSGAYKQMYDNHTKAKQLYDKMTLVLDDQVEGFKIDHKMPNGSVGKFAGFQNLYTMQSKDNNTNLEAAQKTALAPELYQKLRLEYDHLWTYKPDANISSTTNGVYDQFLRQLKQERELAKNNAEFFKKEAAKFEELKKRCGSVGSSTSSISDANANGDPTTRPHGRGNPGAGAPPADQKPPEQNNETPPPADASSRPPPAAAPPAAEPPPAAAPPPAESPNSGGSFLQKNWMWLVGGGVLVGGGIYLYKRHKKKEKERANERAYWGNDANFATSNSSSSSSSSTTINIAAGGQVPAGTKLIVVTPPSGASVGQAVSKIDVALVNADGVIQSIDGLAIEASCLSPNPCSLSGGKSVTSLGGRATFDSLMFNQPDRGVVMQFSGPGLQSVTTQGSFDVSGTAPRE